MHTFFGTPAPDDRTRWRQYRSIQNRAVEVRDRLREPPRRPASDAGFALIEVIISALLVAMIVVSTLTGFDAFNRASADERHHSVAAVLAAQSQERLRSDPASALVALESASHKYETTVGGTVYTITQEAKPVSASGTTTGCSVTETTAQTGANIQVTSIVTWPQLGSSRPSVKQSSIISPPTGSTLEVDAYTDPTYTAGVSGITAAAKFTPVESKTPTTIEGTTGAAGCVVLSGIAATSATLEIAERLRFVTTTGALKVPPKEVTIAPNITTHAQVVYNEGGRIEALFRYKGEKTWEGKEVTGDTFVAFNSAVPSGTQYEIGSTSFAYEGSGEEHYGVKTGVFSSSALTAAGSRYSAGDLFAFPAPQKWVVYAGDCPKNKVEESSVLVEAGKTNAVVVPLSLVQLNVRSGTKTKPGSLESTTYPVTITNSECSSKEVPDNATGTNFRHSQETNKEGHLSSPFQPFGKYELCMYNPTTKRTDTATYMNSKVEGSTVNFYPGELSKTEREAEEAKTKKTREEAEAATKKKREEEELKARETWKTEEAKGTITKKQREEKEAAQTKAREAALTAEATKKKAAEEAEAKQQATSVKEEAERGYTVASGQSGC
jgi:Tfp pilus assembly protein PilV